VLVDTSDGERLVVAQFGRGQYFGETELLRGGTNMATVRAAPDTGARVVFLERETFNMLLAESPSTREHIDQVAEARMAENTNSRNGADHA
jgi:CRP-like cAMP-binding protein